MLNKLEETDLPPGYIKSEGPYFINVSADGTSDNVEGTVIYASVEGHTFTIENVPGAALPHTGGHGTKQIIDIKDQPKDEGWSFFSDFIWKIAQ